MKPTIESPVGVKVGDLFRELQVAWFVQNSIFQFLFQRGAHSFLLQSFFPFRLGDLGSSPDSPLLLSLSLRYRLALLLLHKMFLLRNINLKPRSRKGMGLGKGHTERQFPGARVPEGNHHVSLTLKSLTASSRVYCAYDIPEIDVCRMIAQDKQETKAWIQIIS